MDDFTQAEQDAIRSAEKVVYSACWFCLLDGELVGGPMVGDTITYSDEVSRVDMSEWFDGDHARDLTRAERALELLRDWEGE